MGDVCDASALMMLQRFPVMINYWVTQQSRFTCTAADIILIDKHWVLSYISLIDSIGFTGGGDYQPS